MTTAIADLLPDVYTLTNRPELVAETTLAVQTETFKLHMMDFWKRDMRENRVVLETSGPIQQVNMANFPNFRAFSYIRKYDPSAYNPITQAQTGWPGNLFAEISPAKVLDQYSLPRDNTFYLAMDNLNLFSQSPFQTILVGWFGAPVVSPAARYSSWIADDYPLLVIAKTAARVLGMIGAMEAAKDVNSSANELLTIFVTNNIEATAR